MPKSTINLVGSGSVTVGWSKGGEGVAQVGVGRYEAKGAKPDDPLISTFVDFSHRNEINSLIRALRQARDDAFGRDE